jgi:hypothetical protein
MVKSDKIYQLNLVCKCLPPYVLIINANITRIIHKLLFILYVKYIYEIYITPTRNFS